MDAAIAINQRIRNPASGIAYRLMADHDHWRITRSVPAGDSVSLSHLRGTSGPGDIPAGILAQFVAGRMDADQLPVIADGLHSLRQTLLADIAATSERLARFAADALHQYHRGRPGLRPRCALLQAAFMDASRALHDAWQTMATTWAEHFGSDDRTGLPDWMGTVWEQGLVPWDRRGALVGLTSGV